MTDKQYGIALDLWRSGFSTAGIARRLNVPEWFVWNEFAKRKGEAESLQQEPSAA